MDSFSVRSIFLWGQRDDQRLEYLYEERITLWRAETIDAAIEMAEIDARSYIEGSGEYLGFSQAFALFEPVASSGAEVFSLLRESDLPPRDYLNSFFDTGHEREQISPKE
ncbi:hypothetical protein DVT68_17410 [Dyella solisilvae]|uniref:DUF4288 domain-containing protein n=1 Tax=Dyella solisilvae TaxID=1920168 RepID=A0A370K560_9GAMM|nr:hypothetical protein [Dyella solisilvae]RDI97150.1 hypothetical protein DVT68_17410 [Dyella solisilvae]